MKKSYMQSGLHATACALLVVTAGCEMTGYIARGGWAEARIIASSEPIGEVINSPSTPDTLRTKLQLVLNIRRYAKDSLGFQVGTSYSRFALLNTDTLSNIVSAANKRAFVPYLWRFPIVGAVPYKGFFVLKDAQNEAARLEREGNDTWVRPTSAFSTLGYLPDPLMSSVTRLHRVQIASTVFHELFHNGFYLKSNAPFNESLAEFAGAHAAINWFCGEGRGVTRDCELTQEIWHDQLLMSTVYGRYVDALKAVYTDTVSPLDSIVARRERARLVIAKWYHDSIKGQLKVGTYGFVDEPVNNARIASSEIYYRKLGLFEEVLAMNGGDLRKTLAVIESAAYGNTKDPYAGVEKLLLAAH